VSTLMSGDDVPSTIDFRDPAQAKAWTATTMARRPYRTQFFAGFVAAIRDRFSQSISLLELGSGPGHLAEQILRHCQVSRYVALDFSAAMHDLAHENLGALASKMEFVERDFRAADWPKGLGLFDGVVTMQAAHETRHKRHLPDFLSRARQCLAPEGMLLYCDHYWEAGTAKNPELDASAEEQLLALRSAGFTHVERLLDIGGMALIAAVNSGTP
jgi:SAM-dependent methyltransferase